MNLLLTMANLNVQNVIIKQNSLKMHTPRKHTDFETYDLFEKEVTTAKKNEKTY